MCCGVHSSMGPILMRERKMTIDQESRQLQQQQVSVTYEQQRGTLVYECIYIIH